MTRRHSEDLLESHAALGLLLAQFMLAPSLLLAREGVGTLVAQSLFVVLLVIIIGSSKLRRAELVIFLVLGLSSTLARVPVGNQPLVASWLADLLLITVLGRVLVIGFRSFHGRDTATAGMISGAISVYLLAGAMFTLLYGIIQSANAGAFNHVGGTSISPADMHYFSFVTLTSLGYGDIAPVSSWARTVALTEALFGQIFLVVTLGRLVALQLQAPADRRLGTASTLDSRISRKKA